MKPVVNKIQALAVCSIPETNRHVRCFLGLVSYYWRFIPGFASIAATLTDLKGNNTKRSNGMRNAKSVLMS